MRRIRCSNCNELLFEGALDDPVPPDLSGQGGRPCPDCGSTTRHHELNVKSSFEATGAISTGRPIVVRSVNADRLAAFLALLTFPAGIGVGVGLATSPGLGVVAWLAALGVLAMVLWLVFRGGRPTHWIMELMHRVTGR